MDARSPVAGDEPDGRARTSASSRSRRRRQGQGDTGAVRLLHARRARPERLRCSATAPATSSTAPRSTRSRWNAIAHDDPTKYTVADGALSVTTVAGDIYAGPTGGGTLLLQAADHAGAGLRARDEALRHDRRRLPQGGIIVYGDDDNYVKLDAISDDGHDRINRIELRSRGRRHGRPDPQPQIADVPAGTTHDLAAADEGRAPPTRASTRSTAATVDGVRRRRARTPMVVAAVRPLHARACNSSGDTVTFDYFKVDGDGPAARRAREHRAGDRDRDGDADDRASRRCTVDFTAAATDADDDDAHVQLGLDGDGTPTSTQQNPSHTYTTAGTYTAKVTVTDGEAHGDQVRSRCTVLGAGRPERRAFRALVFSKTTGFRHDSIPAGIAAIRALGEANDFQVDATEDASRVPRTRSCRTTTSSSSCRRRATRSTTTSRRRSSATSARAAATPASTRRPTPSTTGPGTASWWARTSATTRPARRPRRCSSRTRTTTRRRPAEPAGTRVDEWYNYQRPRTRSSAADDYSPRAGGVHVLPTLDESTYAEDDGNTTDDDHPISWCQRYDGGRSWYTGMGHTQASFAEARLPQAPPRRPRGRGRRGRGRGLRDRRAGNERADGDGAATPVGRRGAARGDLHGDRHRSGRRHAHLRVGLRRRRRRASARPPATRTRRRAPTP